MRLILAVLVLLIPILGSTQNCGTDEHHVLLKANDEAYVRNLKKANDAFESYDLEKSSRSSQTPILIPLVFHIIHNGEAQGRGANISDDQIYESVAMLNEAFSAHEDFGFEFCLANFNPQNQPSNGINRIDGRVLFGYEKYGIRHSGDVGVNPQFAKDLSRWPSTDYYNVWVVNQIKSASGQLIGFAEYPNGGKYDGTMITYNGVKGSTLVHEVGHGFNLLHTFNGDGSGCPDNDNCSLQGDKVCDTPPHVRAQCGQVLCGGSRNALNSSLNFMSYCSGRDRFTEGQRERMYKSLMVFPRSSLVSSYGCQLAPLNELNLVEVKREKPRICADEYQPIIRIRNQGRERLKYFTVSCYLDGRFLGAKRIYTDLRYGEYSDYLLSPIQLNVGNNDLLFRVSSPNGSFENTLSNNEKRQNLFFNNEDEILAGDFNEDFDQYTLYDELPRDWSSHTTIGREISNESNWDILHSAGNSWISINTIAHRADPAEQVLTSPQIDLSNKKSNRLSFSYSFGNTLGKDISQTSLSLEACTDCNNSCVKLWERRGNQLITFLEGSPYQKSSYKNFTVNLGHYDGEVISFRFIHKYSNPQSPILNIDDLNISGENEESNVVNDQSTLSVTACPFNIVRATSTNGAFVSWALPNANTTCQAKEIQIVQTQGFSRGSFFPLGESQITYRLSDACGNTGYCQFSVKVENDAPETNGPDLILENILVEESAVDQGSYLNYQFDIKNIGSENAQGFRVHAYLSKDKNLSPSDVQGSSTSASLLVAGQGIQKIKSSFYVPNALDEGYYYLLMFIDGREEVTESNESNNISTSFSQIKVGNIESEPCSSTYESYHFIGEFEGSYYFYSSQKSTWSEANNQSNTIGHLASIESKEENDFLYSNMPDEIFFIGLNDENLENNFVWTSGGNFSFDNVVSANSRENDYAYINFWDGKWGLDGMWTERKHLLEVPCAQNIRKDELEKRSSKIGNTYDDHLATESLKIYPIPCSDELNISLDPKHEFDFVNCYNLNGQVLMTFDVREKTSTLLNMNSFESGIYYLKFYSKSGEQIVKKFIVAVE